MQYRILGPLELDVDGRLLDLGRPKQRALLARLLVSANAVVSADRLADDLWAGEPPDDAPAALQVQVSRLRKVLAHRHPDGPSDLESRKPGYVLHVPAGGLDAERFERLTAEAAAALAGGDPAGAVERLDTALALWRGPALAEFADEGFARPEAVRLEELRLVALEQRAEAELALGRHAAIVASLRQLASAHPLRERLWGQLMVALYRCGRQAEALRAYAELRGNLGEELGIDPSPALRHLEEAVLLQAPALDWDPPAPASSQSSRPASAAAGPAALPFPVAAADDASPFVGRVTPLHQLRGAWEQARRRGPRLVLLAGEPGVGKTRLALQLAGEAHGDGARVLVGHCDEELAVPYQPFAEALGRALGQLPPDELETCLAGRVAQLARLLPDVGDVGGVETGVPPPPASDPETERYRLFEAVVRTLAGLARAAPVVLVLEDLHWAAKPTLLLLRHVVTRSEPMPLLVVGTYRDTEQAGSAAALDLLAGLERANGVSRLPLGGLDEAAVRDLVGAVAGAGLADAGAALAASLYAGTAGNPFFIGEVLRHLAEVGGPARGWSIESSGVPEGVRGVVRRRLARLSGRANRLLAVAAVVGVQYDVRVVQAAAGLGEDSVLAGLDEALAAGLVAESRGEGLRQRFTHAIVRATLWEAMSGARRAQLHRLVGEAMEQVFAGQLDDHLPDLARHFSEAAALGTAASAVAYSTLAGDRALAQLAHDEAASHYQRALGLLPAGPDRSDARRCDLLLALGEAQRRSGAPGHRQTLLDAGRLASRLGDPERLARAALANSRGFWSATSSVDGERVTVLEAALDALSHHDSPLRARVLANLAVELVYTGDTDGVRRRSDEALAMARRLGDLPTLASVLGPRYNTIRGDPGTLPERLANTAELLHVAKALPDPSLRCQAWGWRAVATLEAGDADESGRCFEVFDRLSSELRQPTTLWFATYMRAGRALLAGRFEEAERLSGEAFHLGRSAGHADAELFLSCQRIQLAFETGGLARWERPLRVALGRRPESRWFLRSWQALSYCELDRLDQARPIFDDLAAKDFADLAIEPTWLYLVCNCAAAGAALGDPNHAAALLELLRPYADQVVTLSSLAYAGSASHYLGMLSATLRRFDDASGWFEQAVGVHARIGAAPWLARARLEWGRSLLSAGGRAAAGKAQLLLEQALVAAADLGMATVARRARRLLGRP